jgi:hypothetical protein
VRLADLPAPTTPATTAAEEVLRRFSPPALVNHCHRAYRLAAALAVQEGRDPDWELLYVASLLHDIALEPAFDNHTLPFEEAGGHVAWVFAAGAGWSVERRDHAAAVIVAHMAGTDPALDYEGDLLDRATGLDISGRGVEHWPAGLLTELIAAYPRLDLAERFAACFREQARRKPGSTAGAAVRSGLPERLAANPLERIGQDDV